MKAYNIITVTTISVFLLFSTAPAQDIVIKQETSDSREYHVRYEIPPHLISFIKSFAGIEHVFHQDRYMLNIYKGDAFKWSDVEYEIISALYQRGYLGL